jgi:hypothetical protein
MVPPSGGFLIGPAVLDSAASQNTGTQPPARQDQFRGSKSLFPRNVSFGQVVFNCSRMAFGQPCNQPSLKHCRAFRVPVPDHPIAPGVAPHKKTR